jgi:hypothetical protein
MMTHNLIIVTEISIEFATLDLHVMELSRVSPMSIIMLGALAHHILTWNTSYSGPIP